MAIPLLRGPRAEEEEESENPEFAYEVCTSFRNLASRRWLPAKASLLPRLLRKGIRSAKRRRDYSTNMRK